jgi:hypothetical protein
MPARSVALLLLCLAAVPLLAQARPSDDVPASAFSVEVPEAPKPQDPAPGNPEAARGERRIHLIGQAVRGPATDSFADSPAALPTVAFIVNADTSARPLIVMKLGTSASTFNVFDAADFPLLTVQSDGITKLARDQNTGTYLAISNANAGSAGATPFTGIRFTEGSTVKAMINSIGSASSSAAGGAGALQFWNVANAPTIFATNSTERMRINPGGDVSLNYAGDSGARLTVQHGVSNTSAIFVTHQPSIGTSATLNDKGISIQTQETVGAGVTNAGSEAGLYSWTHLMGTGTLSTLYGARIEVGAGAAGTISNEFGVHVFSIAATGSTVSNGYGVFVADVAASNDYAFYQSGANDSNYFAGNMIIGGTAGAVPAGNALYVTGDANFVGTVTGTNIRANYQDVAEWVPATTPLTPGTVVILNRARDNEVMASTTAYDTAVAGVVSAQPGLSLGVEGAGKEQIATTGRVRVRVDARTAPVHVGDLLVTSDMPGMAMRSEPLTISGRSFHQPGTIIGKALQPLPGGVGEILVLLSMQ